MQTSDIIVLAGITIAVWVILHLASESKNTPVRENTLPLAEFEPEQIEPPLPAVGHEIGLPFDEDELAAEVGASDRRPEIINYFFKDTKLETGPPDVSDFVDELTIAMENSFEAARWTAVYVVATPGGLQRLLREKNYEYVYGDSMIIVPQYNLQIILQAAIEREFAAYSDDPGGNELIDKPEIVSDFDRPS